MSLARSPSFASCASLDDGRLFSPDPSATADKISCIQACPDSISLSHAETYFPRECGLSLQYKMVIRCRTKAKQIEVYGNQQPRSPGLRRIS